MRRALGLVVVLGTGLVGLSAGPAPAADAPPAPGLAAAEAAADAHGSVKVVVQLATPQGVRAAQTAVAATLRGTGARVTRTYSRVPAIALRLTPAAVDALRHAPGIKRVVRDFPLSLNLAESAPLVGATETTTNGDDGSGRVIAILDTGVDNDHPFLAGKVIAGAEACFASDCAIATGADAADNCTIAGTHCSHGTHVAGIAAGKHTADMPYDGVAPAAKILAVRIFQSSGTTQFSNILAGLEHVYSLRNDYDIAAVNMSLGTTAPDLFAGADCDSFDGGLLKGIVADLRAAGTATVVAAGNSGSSTSISYPGCLSNVIAVGNTTKADLPAASGNSSNAMELWAPGTSITSSVPNFSGGPGGAGTLSGTSMSTPHVAAAFAVLDEHFPAMTVDEKLQWLLDHGVAVTRAGVTKPRLDLHALAESPPPSNAPTNVVAIAGDTNATVSWQAPIGLSPTHYIVTASPGNRTVKVEAPNTSAKMSSLTNGQSYVFSVRALVSSESSDAATSNPVTPVSRVYGDDVTTVEGASAALKRVRIEMKNASRADVTVFFQTENGVTADGKYGAKAGTDYEAQTGSAVIPAGSRQTFVNVVVLGDNVLERSEYLIVRLTGANGATISDSSIRLTIKNDD